jgi:dihydroorotate dehydrogenase electron transfer subunit
MRHQLEVPILAHERLADYEYELTLAAPEIAAESRPGQFMQVLYDQTYNPFTRRPFSVYKVDKEQGTFSIVYLARGVFTLGLRNKQVGQKLSVVGPLGNWFEPDPRPVATHLLVGGGVGAPPLYFMAEEMSHDSALKSRIRVVNGARSRELLVGIEEFNALGVDIRFTTDDGSYGQKGIVTDALVQLLDETAGPVHVYTCGPTPMLRAVGDLCLSRGVPCQVSVETMMPCGLGVCMGCVVKIKAAESPTGYSHLRSCYEGPVFAADRIVWE